MGAKTVRLMESVTIRFAGDSGDGVQLMGSQFSDASAVLGNDISVMPEYPAEIRAPIGTTYGVSGYQLQFSSFDIDTPGDHLDALVAMNAASLKVNLDDVIDGGLIIANTDGFSDRFLELAGYESNPLEDGSLDKYDLHTIPITTVTALAVEELGLKGRQATRCKNFYALGVVMWVYNRGLDTILKFIEKKFSKDETTRDANIRALRAGWYYGETTEIFASSFQVSKARIKPGRYRNISGNQATALGLIAASQKSGKPLFYASYPITPATDILHELAAAKNFGVRTVQSEDEIAAITACIGSAFGGGLAVTGTSGPGLALKSEGINLAVMTELPVVIVNVQRGGPSTGLPTKPEQGDLLQAMFGRNGESPIPVVSARSPGDCFYTAFEACKIAMQHMTPVIMLSDAFLANGAGPWKIPDAASIDSIEIEHPQSWDGPFQPYARDEKLARPWAIPGTAGLQHRLGGLEKRDVDGDVCYDAKNHQLMTDLRQQKVDKIADYVESANIVGAEDGGELLLLGWGSTYGPMRATVKRMRKEAVDVSMISLRWVNPFPKNLGDLLKRFNKIMIPEMNGGQLTMLIRAKYLVDAQCFSRVGGRPFRINVLEDKVREILGK